MSFHRFNSFTGRLMQSSQFEALSPIQPHPLQKTDIPKMMFDSIKTKIATVSSPNQKNCSTISPKILKWRKVFQADLSKPTYVLRGKTDKILVRSAATLVTVGCIINIYFLYELCKKY